MYAIIVTLEAVRTVALHVVAVMIYGAKGVKRREMNQENRAVGILNFMLNYGKSVTQTLNILLMDGNNCLNPYSR